MRNLATDTSGATAIEYALIAGLIFLAIVTAVGTLGSTISSTLYASMASVP
ncbi:MAG TPA: Flp family type IVb pilin [Rhizomicrobium sp.]|nr:Flp family type IVb pilin [Rhizomicrobium sp.]